MASLCPLQPYYGYGPRTEVIVGPLHHRGGYGGYGYQGGYGGRGGRGR